MGPFEAGPFVCEAVKLPNLSETVQLTGVNFGPQKLVRRFHRSGSHSPDGGRSRHLWLAHDRHEEVRLADEGPQIPSGELQLDVQFS